MAIRKYNAINKHFENIKELSKKYNRTIDMIKIILKKIELMK